MSIENSKLLKRQIEILGLVIMEREKVFDIYELALLFRVSEITIQRDLQTMRKMGVDIGSAGEKGVKLYGSIRSEIITKLLMDYLAINYSEYLYDILDYSMDDQERKLLIENFVNIQNAIENKKKITLLLKDEINSEAPRLYYEPRLIFRNKSHWSVLLSNDFEFTVIPVSQIMEIRLSEESSKEIDKKIIKQKLNELLGKNITEGKFKIKLALAKLEKENIPYNIMKVNVYREKDDGTIELEAEVNSLDKIANWVFSKSKDILIIEPEELQIKIFEQISLLYKKLSSKLHKKESDVHEKSIVMEPGELYSIGDAGQGNKYQLYIQPESVIYNEIDYDLNISIYSN